MLGGGVTPGRLAGRLASWRWAQDARFSDGTGTGNRWRANCKTRDRQEVVTGYLYRLRILIALGGRCDGRPENKAKRGG